MARIGFLGLDDLGLAMARHLMAAGHVVTGYDPVSEYRRRFVSGGGRGAESTVQAVDGAEIVISVLETSEQVSDLYLGSGAVMRSVEPGTLLIDCSPIDVATARALAGAADMATLPMIDAPFFGDVDAAERAQLRFVVGGLVEDIGLAHPYLKLMGADIMHAGAVGNGQAARLCHQMLMAIQMIGVCESLSLAEKLGVDPDVMAEIFLTSGARCGVLADYVTFMELVPPEAAQRDYIRGYSSANILKDLRLSQQASIGTKSVTPLGAEAATLFAMHINHGHGDDDFTSIIDMLRGA